MRNLTIKRRKSFVGCLVSIKIYIEDHFSPETTINNVPCRKIGEIKNGEEKTFQIENQATRVFAIIDQLSKSYCNEYYDIPEGQYDIYLSGQNELKPFSGNAFRFDNNFSAGITQNRKRGNSKGLIITIVAIVIGAIIGFSSSFGLFFAGTPEPTDFSSNGMTVTLTDEFVSIEDSGYTVAYDSADVAVLALKEEFTLLDGFEDYTLQQYADMVIEANSIGSPEIKTDEDLMWFEYDFTNPDTNDTYRYYSYVFKAGDAFWLVQFATLDSNVDEYSQQIDNWARTVTFSE